MSSPTRFTLVRHGETPANTGGVWHGSTDTPLSDRGRLQANRVAEHLAGSHGDAVAVYSSPLERARHTAEPIGRSLSIEPAVEPGIREFHLGRWEGKTYEALMREHELWQNMARDPDFKPHGGESGRDVVDRFQAALDILAGRHPGKRVILVSHGAAMSLFMSAVFRDKLGEWYDPMHNCAISELVLAPEPQLLDFNAAAHLDGI